MRSARLRLRLALPLLGCRTVRVIRGRAVPRGRAVAGLRGRCVCGAWLDAFLREALAQVVERAGLLALVDRPAIVVPDLEVIHHPDDHHVLREAAPLAIVLQDLDAHVRIEHHVETGREIHVLESTAIRIELGETVHAVLELAPLVLGVHVERGAVGRHHEPITAGLTQHLAELRRDAESPFRVDRVPEMSPKHCLPRRGTKLAPGPALNDTSWDFNPLRGTILGGIDWGCQAKTPDFQAIPSRRKGHRLGVARAGLQQVDGGPRGTGLATWWDGGTSGPRPASPGPARCGSLRRGASTATGRAAGPWRPRPCASTARAPRGDRSPPSP